MTFACQPRGGYPILSFLVCRCRYEQSFSGNATDINRAQNADCIARTRALRMLRAQPDFQALFTQQRSVAENACVEQVNQDRYDTGISAPYKEINLPLEDKQAEEEVRNEEEDNPVATAVAMATKLPSAAPAPQLTSPGAPTEHNMRSNIGQWLGLVAGRWESYGLTTSLFQLQGAEDPTSKAFYMAQKDQVRVLESSASKGKETKSLKGGAGNVWHGWSGE